MKQDYVRLILENCDYIDFKLKNCLSIDIPLIKQRINKTYTNIPKVITYSDFILLIVDDCENTSHLEFGYNSKRNFNKFERLIKIPDITCIELPVEDEDNAKKTRMSIYVPWKHGNEDINKFQQHFIVQYHNISCFAILISKDSSELSKEEKEILNWFFNLIQKNNKKKNKRKQEINEKISKLQDGYYIPPIRPIIDIPYPEKKKEIEEFFNLNED